ncbi:MAG: 3-phosphoserine/phosphohydroxythreonine transaminase [Provencibacterium sp.]|jgi:phosphoserine aminotransferase|nr:3-phosphoserine/phosphohydroxythreonine transaminase [Provencibacterium sp.]
MARVYNFSAGPSVLPESVLQKAADEMLDYHGCGQSVMEMSHRSSQYEEIIGGCESLLRQTLQIPDDYDVLFLQGGASSQFAMVPMNLKKKGRADFVLTGQWAKKAFSEGKKFLTAHAVADSSDKTYSYIPKLDPADFDPEADYFHICYNNTIYGTRFHELPDTGNVPLVADMSSCILSEPVDIRRFGLVYAGAQKNMGPAGLTVVIVRKDLVGNAGPDVPTMFDYKIHADNGSMYNTPPCYAIYICKLVLEWIRDEMGGLEGMKAFNEKKAKLFYDYLDSSRLFRGTVEPADRSLMNIPFITGSDALNKQFVQQAEAAGFVNLKGHRSVGGMRASIYNAMPLEGVEKLCAFMKEFEEKNA